MKTKIIFIATVLALMAPAAIGRPVPKGTAVLRDVPYVTKGRERQKLDLYLPEPYRLGTVHIEKIR